MKDYSHRNLTASQKRKITRNLVICWKHDLSAAAGGKCLRCCKEAKKARVRHPATGRSTVKGKVAKNAAKKAARQPSKKAAKRAEKSA